MHLALFVRDLAIIWVVATFVSSLFDRIRQYVVFGYLLAGVIAGPYSPPFSFVLDLTGIRLWGELSALLLLFSLGLDFNFKRLFRVGITAAVTGALGALFMMGFGFAAGKFVGWKTIDCLFLGAIISISSTTIATHAFREPHLKRKHFAQLIFDILTVENLIGIFTLLALSTLAISQSHTASTLIGSTPKLILIIASGIVIGSLTIPRLMHFAGKRVPDKPESPRIKEQSRTIRNFFVPVFFVSMGMQLNPSDVALHCRAILMITALTIAGKIFSTTLGARITGQSMSTSIQVGFGLAHIGEFSFIFASLGLGLGIMNPALYSIAVTVSILTASANPFLILISRLVALKMDTRFSVNQSS